MRKFIFSKETEKKLAFISGMGLMLILSAVFFASYSVVTSRITAAHAQEALVKEKSQEVTVYEVKNKIGQGNPIQKNDIKSVNCPKQYAVKNGLVTDANVVGKIARIDLNQNTQLTAGMVTDSNNVVTNDLRKQDYSCIVLNKNLIKGQYIDIRLKRKDGSDYVVAAKKQVIDLTGSTVIIQISEKERDYINSAIVDASITGATLYSTIYVDEVNQSAAAITYVPNASIKDLISNNPNVVNNAQSTLKNQINTNNTNNQTNTQTK